jgi:hypothetical protein
MIFNPLEACFAPAVAALLVLGGSFTYLDPANFPIDFAPDLPREQAAFEARSQVLTAAKVFTTPMTVAATVVAGASHSVYESRPKEVAAVIEDAAQHAQG